MRKISFAIIAVMLFVCGCTDYIENGTNHLNKGNYEKAIQAFQKEIDDEDNLDQAYRGMGIAQYELGNYELALEAFDGALKNKAAETAELCAIMGACYMKIENFEKAIEVYEKALAKKGISKELKQEVQYNMIAAYEFMGNWDMAKTMMETYVEQYPDDTRVDKEADFLETR